MGCHEDIFSVSKEDSQGGINYTLKLKKKGLFGESFFKFLSIKSFTNEKHA